RQQTFAGSALDLRWMDEVDPSRGVLLTAQGLLMYLHPVEVAELVAACAERFPGAALVFDAIPRWLSARTPRGEMRAGGYTSPPSRGPPPRAHGPPGPGLPPPSRRDVWLSCRAGARPSHEGEPCRPAQEGVDAPFARDRCGRDRGHPRHRRRVQPGRPGHEDR